jgi:serine/threonine protein kinase
MALRSGTKLGPYEIQSPLGAGGMGEVYRARDTRLGRDVAIKVLPEALAHDADRLRRFEQEARAIAALNHPNILGIHDIGTHEGAPFLVSEFLEGQTLREKLVTGPLPVRRAIEYALGIVEGLAAAHEKGVVHRDLKPENVFVTRDGRMKVLDFGLAKLVRPEENHEPAVTLTDPTLPGMVMGTVGYMSPEQVRGEPCDARSDIFSFGAVLYEMLTGKRTFKRETSAETMTAILRDEPQALNDTGWQGPLELQRILARCLEKNVARRFQSASDLGFAIESLRGTSSGVSTGTSTAKSLKQPKSRRAWLPWIIAAALLMGTAVWEMRRPEAVPPNPLEKAHFMRVTDFKSVEAAISPDGRFVAFVSDDDGPFDVWLTQVGTGRVTNLTQGKVGPLPGPLRSVGFSGDGSEIWLGGGDVGMRLRLMPLTGGAPRNFLGERPSTWPGHRTASALSIIPSVMATRCSWRTPLAPVRGGYSRTGRDFTIIFQLGRLTAVGSISRMGRRRPGTWTYGASTQTVSTRSASHKLIQTSLIPLRSATARSSTWRGTRTVQDLGCGRLI